MINNLILLSLAGFFNASMDILKCHYKDSVFGRLGLKYKWFERWAGPLSWLNKYKDRTISKGPAFWGSKTIFVFSTDAWHFAQLLWRVCFTLAVAPVNYLKIDFLPVWISDFTVNSLTYLIIFNLFYEKILKRR